MLKYCLVTKSDNLGNSIIVYNNVESSVIDNIFYDNYNAVKIQVSTSIQIGNNYFKKGYHHLKNELDSYATVENNIFEDSDIGISNTGRSNIEVKLSNIQADICFWTYHSGNMYNTINNGWLKVTNCNLQAAVYAIKSEGRYYYANVEPYPLDFKNNYWTQTSLTEIDQLIYDVNDSPPPHNDEYNWAIVEYVPFKTSKVSNAGIE